jgi:hypothetical protein
MLKAIGSLIDLCAQPCLAAQTFEAEIKYGSMIGEVNKHHDDTEENPGNKFSIR